MTLPSSVDIVPTVAPADHVPGPAQGCWTVEDWLAWYDVKSSEDRHRYELIAGVLMLAPPPETGHESTNVHVVFYLVGHVVLDGRGAVFGSNVGVQLGPNTLVQPDICVVLNSHRDRVTPARIVGAPDLVVEIASPSTRTYDRNAKLRAYAEAGVPEYWLVEAGEQTVEPLVLEHGAYRSLGIFSGQARLPSRVLPDFDVPEAELFRPTRRPR